MKHTYLIPLLLALPVTAYSAPHPVQQAALAATAAKKTAKQLEQDVETALKKAMQPPTKRQPKPSTIM